MEPQFNCPITMHRNGTCTVTFCVDFGNFTPDDFIIIAHLAKKYQVNTLSATTSKRITFTDTPPEQVNPLWDALQNAFGDRLNPSNGKITACIGNPLCRYAVEHLNASDLAKEIARLTLEYPACKMKIAISNCPRSCSNTHVRDISITAVANGWKLAVGGNGGVCPGLSQTIASGLSEDELLQLIRRFYAYVQEHALENERSIHMVRRIGFEQVKAALLAE